MRRLLLPIVACCLLVASIVCTGAALADPSEVGPASSVVLAVPVILAEPAPVPATSPTTVPPVLLDPSSDPGGFAKAVKDALVARQWGFAAVLAILGLLALVGRLVKDDTARAGCALLAGLILPIPVVLIAGTKLTWGLYLGTLMTTAAASGVWSWGKKLGRWALGKLKIGGVAAKG